MTSSSHSLDYLMQPLIISKLNFGNPSNVKMLSNIKIGLKRLKARTCVLRYIRVDENNCDRVIMK